MDDVGAAQPDVVRGELPRPRRARDVAADSGFSRRLVPNLRPAGRALEQIAVVVDDFLRRRVAVARERERIVTVGGVAPLRVGRLPHLAQLAAAARARIAGIPCSRTGH
jgi:hypothetical protein